MGRVNTGKRYRYAEFIGCDSVDGTHLAFDPTIGLTQVMRWQETTSMTLFDGTLV